MAKKGTTARTGNGALTVRVNPKIYPLPIVQQAADVFIDRAYVFLDGNPEKEIKVILKPKDRKTDLGKLCGEFNNELVDYSAYFVRSQISRDVREALVRRAFLTASGGQEPADDLEARNRRIDFGTKVPLVGDSEKSGNAKKVKEKPVKNADKLSDILAPWDKQKGAIKKEPRK